MENINIEEGIIGCILVNPEKMFEIYNLVTPEMFCQQFTRRVYTKLLSMYDRGIEIDLVMLASECSTPEIEPKIFEKKFSELIVSCPTSILLKDYVAKLIANYQCNRLRMLIKEIEIDPNTINDTLGTIQKGIDDITLNRKERTKRLKNIIDSFDSEYFVDNNAEKNNIKFNIGDLDDSLSLKGGEVTIIGARPAVGKSAFALQIVKNVARQGKRVGYFNLEMLDQQIYERFVCGESGIELQRLKRAIAFLGNEKEKFETANNNLRALDIKISSGSFSISEIKAECRHQDYELIVIDYLQLIRSDRPAERRIEIGQISRQLKELAMELDVPIIVLSQLSRKSEYTQSKEPNMTDLRESGDIEQDASTIILMWNLSDTFREYKGLKVDKNRQGKLFDMPMKFNGDYMSFEPIRDKTIEQIKNSFKDFEPIADDETPFN